MPADLVVDELARGSLVQIARRAWHVAPLTFVVSRRRGHELSACEGTLVQIVDDCDLIFAAFDRRGYRLRCSRNSASHRRPEGSLRSLRSSGLGWSSAFAPAAWWRLNPKPAASQLLWCWIVSLPVRLSHRTFNSKRAPAEAVVLAIFLSVVSGSIGAAVAAPPVPLPPVDLGATSFLDGEAAPGGLLETAANGYRPTNAPRSASVLLHLAYVWEKAVILGGHLGAEALLPAATLHGGAAGSAAGLGDAIFGLAIQWSHVRVPVGELSMRLGVPFTVPSGSYNPLRTLNVGQNVWQLSPYFAMTWRPDDRWELSGRIIYNWSSRNGDPPAAFMASSVQPGTQLAMNLAASRTVWDGLRLGVAGYALQQLTDSRVDALSTGARQRGFGIGPGMLWTGGKATVVANVYREFAADNRPEGYSAVVRFLYPF
jgi:hypothetical protein